MQDNKFVVAPNNKSAMISNQLYNCIDAEIDGVMKSASTGELVFIHEYSEREAGALVATRNEIISNFFPETDKMVIESDTEEYEVHLLDKMHDSKRYQNIIYPYSYTWGEKDGRSVLYTVSELPADFTGKYHTISKAIFMPNFKLHVRIVTAINIAEMLKMLWKDFQGLLHNITPDSILVNTENGDVKIIIEKCMDKGRNLEDVDAGDYMCLCGTEKECIDEQMLTKYIAYSTFRLLCMSNPYDGRKTLVEFPLLTRRANRMIHSGDYDFILSESTNMYSEFIGREVVAKWNSIPVFLRERVEQELRNDDNAAVDSNLEDWVRLTRMLRDSLVFVNGQFKFCDPNENNRVLFIATKNKYRIPVWPRKAVYWYHLGCTDEDKCNKVAIGVNSEGWLENHTFSVWSVESYGNTYWINPGQAVKPELGMYITIADDLYVGIINGDRGTPISV